MFDPIVDFDFVDRRKHSCSLTREIVKQSIAYCGVDSFIFAGLEHFDNVVLVWLLRFNVDTREFGRELGVADVRVIIRFD
jgi:hypothetical protein